MQEGDTVLLLTDSAESLSGETELRQRLEQMGVTVQGRIFAATTAIGPTGRLFSNSISLPDLDAIVVFSAKSYGGRGGSGEILKA